MDVIHPCSQPGLHRFFFYYYYFCGFKFYFNPYFLGEIEGKYYNKKSA